MGLRGSKSQKEGSMCSAKTEYSEQDVRDAFEQMPKLKEEEIQVLKTSWQLIGKRIDEVGRSTFLYLFQAHPDAQQIFQTFRGNNLVDLEQSHQLLQHGERVTRILDQVINLIDEPKEVWEILLQLGRNHFKYGALPMYLELMGPHFVIATREALDSEWYEALEYHWLALFDLIVFAMKFGWGLERSDEQARARMLQKAPVRPNDYQQQRRLAGPS